MMAITSATTTRGLPTIAATWIVGLAITIYSIRMIPG